MSPVLATNSALAPSPAGVIIDWARLINEKNEESDTLMDWVRTYPAKKDIHVYLGSVKERHTAWKLRRMLMALGCTVTSKHQITS